MKKLIILSALLATLAACNNLENNNQQTVSTTTVVNTLKILWISAIPATPTVSPTNSKRKIAFPI